MLLLASLMLHMAKTKRQSEMFLSLLSPKLSLMSAPPKNISLMLPPLTKLSPLSPLPKPQLPSQSTAKKKTMAGMWPHLAPGLIVMLTLVQIV
jgi:hypothetical protein